MGHMPRDDTEFAAWLAARWSPLVRVLVLMGTPLGDAVRLASAGIARCRPGWDRLRTEGDVDVEVHALVLAERQRWRRRHPDAVADLPAEDDGVRVALAALSTLPDEEAEVVALRAATDLDEPQVAEVLGVPLGTARDRVASAARAGVSEAGVREAARSIDVPPPAYDEVAVLVQERRRRTRRVAAAVTVAVLAVAVAVAWAASRPTEPEDGPLPVVVVRNAAGIDWYADGRLHLRSVTVEIAGLVDLAAVGESVAYLDEEGEVGLVDARGARSVLGTAVPGSRVLGSGEDSWVAWLEPGTDGTGDQQLVVWSVAADELLASTPVGAGTSLVAIDQHRVYLQDDEGFSTWEAAQPGAEPEWMGSEELAGVASAVRVFQHGDHVEMVQPFFSVQFRREGQGASVSPGGSFVISRQPGPWEPGSPFIPLVYDTRSGERLPSGVASDEQVVDAAFAELGVVTYFVVKVADLQGASLDGDTGTLLVLRRCDLESGRCSDLLPARGGPGRALLAD